MKVERIDHIHFAVKNLDKATRFFEEILGTKFSEDIVAPEGKVRSRIDPLGIEIIESTSPDGLISKFIESRGEGLHAISFKVSDLDKAVEELQAKGLRLVGRLKVGNLVEAQFHPRIPLEL